MAGTAKRGTVTRIASTGPKPQLRAERDGGWTADKKRQFLAELAATANVRASVRAVGMSEAGLYKLRRRSTDFRKQWESALAEGYARLEMMLLERAMNGVTKPVWYGGKTVGEATEYSDRLALNLLAQHRVAVSAIKATERARPLDKAKLRARLIERFAEMNIRMGGDG